MSVSIVPGVVQLRPTVIDRAIVAELRAVADLIESGASDVVTLCYLNPAKDRYECSTSASPSTGLLMATLLHKAAVDRLFEGPQ